MFANRVTALAAHASCLVGRSSPVHNARACVLWFLAADDVGLSRLPRCATSPALCGGTLAGGSWAAAAAAARGLLCVQIHLNQLTWSAPEPEICSCRAAASASGVAHTLWCASVCRFGQTWGTE